MGGLGALIDRSISAAIGKTADKVGVGVEALQELRFAAKASGVEKQTLDMAPQRFTRRAAEAARLARHRVRLSSRRRGRPQSRPRDFFSNLLAEHFVRAYDVECCTPDTRIASQGLLRGSQVSYSAAAAWSGRVPRRLRGPELAFRIVAGGREGTRR